MLSPRHLELLTAFVDGELTRRQRQAVMKLLHDSSEARSVLQEFQETAHRLRELPRHKLETAFAGHVLAAIAERELEPRSAAPSTPSRPWPRWLSYAAAASILLVVGVGILIGMREGPPKSPPFTVIVTKKTVPALDSERAAEVPLKVTFAELAQAPKRVELAQKLDKETAVHLDVAVRDRAEAVVQLERALKVQGIRTIVDARAQASLKNPEQGKVEYVVYAENLRADELAKLLRELGGPANDKKSTFESLVVTSLNDGHRNQLSDLLGVPASEFETPIRRSGKATDKPSIDRALINTSPKTDRFAMVMAYEAGQGAAAAEAKAFLAARQQQQQPGSVSVLLVIRQA